MPLAARVKINMRRNRNVCIEESSSYSVEPCFYKAVSGIESRMMVKNKSIDIAPQK
jgi:hypothetical protein